MPQRKRKMIPDFSSEDEEREFWERVEVVDFLEGPEDALVLGLRKGKKEGNLTKITLQLEADLVSELKEIARERRVPYRVLACEILAQGIKALKR